MKRNTGPYFYLPKEAELWNDVFVYAQEKLGIPNGTIKSTVLIEHVLATFEADEILYALKDHIVGLNCGRWDYIFSYIKTFRAYSNFLLPDRSLITLNVPFMRHYSKLIIRVSHRRGAHSMGGMAAFIPVENNHKLNEVSLDAVIKDKKREALDGHDGTWVAHPGLVPLAMNVFDQIMPSPNQIGNVPNTKLTPLPSATDLLQVPEGPRTEAGLRGNVSVTLGYLESWLCGQGWVPLYNMMEEAASAEISRTQLWQWLHHGGNLDDGRFVDDAMLTRIISEETDKWEKALSANSTTHGDHSGALRAAAELLQQFGVCE